MCGQYRNAAILPRAGEVLSYANTPTIRYRGHRWKVGDAIPRSTVFSMVDTKRGPRLPHGLVEDLAIHPYSTGLELHHQADI